MSIRRRLALAAVLGLPLLGGAGLAVLGVIPGLKGRYANGDPALATAYRAKETCSCLFVMRLDEATCRAFTEASPDVARIAIDPEARAVSARALVLWSARARFVDDRSGCVLDP